ncbi:hypothetical protein H7H51_00150 [Mycolicibacterium farcinogenes]|nr:hypothetical protein [Mycolicibacterium farcinogenes]
MLNEPASAVALVALSAVSYAVGQVVRLTTAEVEDNIERQRIADESTPMAEV